MTFETETDNEKIRAAILRHDLHGKNVGNYTTMYGGVVLSSVGVHNGVSFGDDVVVTGGIWKRSPLFIRGDQHFVCEVDNGRITSGCLTKTVEEWLGDGEFNMEYEALWSGYSDEQIAQYRSHFEHIAAYMKTHGVNDDTATKF